jgi:hypothetical protein
MLENLKVTLLNASRIDEVFRPNCHSEHDQEKNYKLY